jgi:hypothetical protein
MGLFLLLWLSFWTLGGFLAGREFLRLLFGCDTNTRRSMANDHSYGIFARDNLRATIRRFIDAAQPSALCAETTRGIVELETGTVADAPSFRKPNAAYELSTAPRSRARCGLVRNHKPRASSSSKSGTRRKQRAWHG